MGCRHHSLCTFAQAEIPASCAHLHALLQRVTLWARLALLLSYLCCVMVDQRSQRVAFIQLVCSCVPCEGDMERLPGSWQCWPRSGMLHQHRHAIAVCKQYVEWRIGRPAA